MIFVQIREELRANGIDVYPQKEFDEDAEDRMINDKIRVSSVSGSGSNLNSYNKKVNSSDFSSFI